MRSPIRVAVIDAYPVYRVGVVRALSRSGRFLVVAEGATAADAQRAIRENDPDVVIMDINVLEGAFNALQEIVNSGARCKIAILTARDDALSVSKALGAGAAGYVLKAVTGTELAAAIEAIHAGKPFITAELASRLLSEAKGGPLVAKREAEVKNTALSYREQQMLDHVSKGLTNHEIAEKLGLKVGTIKHYMTKAFRKMKASNRVQAILAAQIISDPKGGRSVPS